MFFNAIDATCCANTVADVMEESGATFSDMKMSVCGLLVGLVYLYEKQSGNYNN